MMGLENEIWNGYIIFSNDSVSSIVFESTLLPDSIIVNVMDPEFRDVLRSNRLFSRCASIKFVMLSRVYCIADMRLIDSSSFTWSMDIPCLIVSNAIL